jgi:hypothetical protein
MSTVGFFVILAMMFFATRSLLSKDSVITKAAMVMVAAGGVTLVLTSAAFGFPTAGIGPWIGFALIAAGAIAFMIGRRDKAGARVR